MSTDPASRGSHARWLGLPALWVLLASWALRGGLLLLKPGELVAQDAIYWGVVGQKLLAGENPYNTTAFLNYPPLWMQVIYGLAKVTQAVGGTTATFYTLLFVTLIAVESLLILAVLRLCGVLGVRGWKAALIAIAVNPATVFQVTVHGNFDVLMTLWVVLFVTEMVRWAGAIGGEGSGGTVRVAGPTEMHREGGPEDARASGGGMVAWLWACALLGLGILTKTVPVVLVPLLAVGVRRLPRTAWGLGAALVFGPAALGMSVIYVLGPEMVWKYVVQYRSVAGWYGFSGLVGMTGVHPLVWGKPFPLMVLVWLVGGSWWLGRMGVVREGRWLVLLAGTVMLGVPTVGPGYGPQYVYWYLPLYAASFVAFGEVWWRRLLWVGLGVLAGTYVVEYGWLHGGGLLSAWGWDTSGVRERWGTPTGQTLLRLPLFLMSVAVLGGSVVMLRKGR